MEKATTRPSSKQVIVWRKYMRASGYAIFWSGIDRTCTGWQMKKTIGGLIPRPCVLRGLRSLMLQ